MFPYGTLDDQHGAVACVVGDDVLMFLFIRMKMMLFIRMKMRVWRRMEMEPVFAHRGEMTLGWILVVTTIIRTTKDKETTSMISN